MSASKALNTNPLAIRVGLDGERPSFGDRVPGRIVLYGATGYIGGLIARAMVAGGARPVLAGRDQGRLDALAERLALAPRVIGTSRRDR